ncbi:hypothetical protein PsorP6_008060 [Peronosclerospora sorghi]|uniref:Uncharacterized protein n=1 Tax=Peronosclerospora sorghi TaxID=230839 RepID=A0ACC0WA14_9STRA|nr:hypothetical protein PsorP6_008060 [Peronosclerospora sorghi]
MDGRLRLSRNVVSVLERTAVVLSVTWSTTGHDLLTTERRIVFSRTFQSIAVANVIRILLVKLCGGDLLDKLGTKKFNAIVDTDSRSFKEHSGKVLFGNSINFRHLEFVFASFGSKRIIPSLCDHSSSPQTPANIPIIIQPLHKHKYAKFPFIIHCFSSPQTQVRNGKPSEPSVLQVLPHLPRMILSP